MQICKYVARKLFKARKYNTEISSSNTHHSFMKRLPVRIEFSEVLPRKLERIISCNYGKVPRLKHWSRNRFRDTRPWGFPGLKISPRNSREHERFESSLAFFQVILFYVCCANKSHM